MPAHKVQTISTHDASDMFFGARAAELYRGTTLQTAACFAPAAAALHVASPVAERDTISHQTARLFLKGQAASR